MKFSLFADDIVIYVENAIKATKVLLEQINEFNKVVEDMIMIQKSILCMYTSNGCV